MIHLPTPKTCYYQQFAVGFDWSDILNGRTLPALRTFEITGRTIANRSDVFVDSLFLDAPMLQELSLRDIIFRVNAPTLRYLELMLDPDESAVPPTQLLSFVSLTPCLEVLILEFAIKRGSVWEGSTRSKVKLSQLQEFIISDRADSILNLWNSISAPTDLSRSLWMNDPSLCAFL